MTCASASSRSSPTGARRPRARRSVPLRRPASAARRPPRRCRSAARSRRRCSTIGCATTGEASTGVAFFLRGRGAFGLPSAVDRLLARALLLRGRFDLGAASSRALDDRGASRRPSRRPARPRRSARSRRPATRRSPVFDHRRCLDDRRSSTMEPFDLAAAQSRLPVIGPTSTTSTTSIDASIDSLRAPVSGASSRHRLDERTRDRALSLTAPRGTACSDRAPRPRRDRRSERSCARSPCTNTSAGRPSSCRASSFSRMRGWIFVIRATSSRRELLASASVAQPQREARACIDHRARSGRHHRSSTSFSMVHGCVAPRTPVSTLPRRGTGRRCSSSATA